MKKSHLFLLVSFIILSGLLSSCAGGVGVASSWPGVTPDEENEVVYVAYNQHVYAVNLANGAQSWRFPAEGDANVNFYAAPALTENGQLLVGAYNYQLYSIDRAGQPSSGNWPFTGARNRYIAQPLVVGEMVFAPNSDGNLYAVDLGGNLRWSYQTNEPLWATPATDGERIYQPSMDQRVYALDAQSGALIWQSDELGGAMVGAPTLTEEGVLYVGTFAPELVALDSDTGSVIWKTPTAGWVWSGPALENGTLYFGDLSGTLYALNAENGQVQWQKDPGDGTVWAISDMPLVLDGTVYYTLEDGSLYAVDAATGNPRWNRAVGGKLYTSPAAAGDLILVTAVGADSLLVAFDSNGNQVWAFNPER